MNKIFLQMFVVFILVGCSRVFEVDNELSDKFVGKTFCTKENLFVWRYEKDQARNLFYNQYFLRRPFRDEKTENEHRKLMTRILGDGGRDIIVVEKFSRLRVTGVFYEFGFLADSGYIVMSEIIGLDKVNRKINMTWLFLPLALNRGDESSARVNESYIGECED